MHVRKDLKRNKRAAFSLTPDFIAGSVGDINFVVLRTYGIQACLIDLDDTIVARGTFTVDPEVLAVLKASGMPVYIATNRPKSRDLKNLRQDLGAKGVLHPHAFFAKPTKHYYSHALKEVGLPAHEVAMIGDRYFQDVLGANRSGIYSIVVNKLGAAASWGDTIVSRLERSRSERFLRRLFTRTD